MELSEQEGPQPHSGQVHGPLPSCGLLAKDEHARQSRHQHRGNREDGHPRLRHAPDGSPTTLPTAPPEPCTRSPIPDT
eukprot:4956814-Pyramimonas_sp.AAC.1